MNSTNTEIKLAYAKTKGLRPREWLIGLLTKATRDIWF
jgi:hypothetical protein